MMWLMEAWRPLKPGGLFCVFVNWRQFPVMTDAIQAASLVWRGAVVWDKSGGNRPQKGPKFHQVGKPENVMDWLLQLAPQGSHILDPLWDQVRP